MSLIKAIVVLFLWHSALAPLTEVAAQSPPISDSQLLNAFAGLPETQDIATTLQMPIAVRGSVLLLPITRRNAQVPWPASIALRLADGRTITGRTAQIESRKFMRGDWASSKQVTATTQAKGDDDIILLAPLPVDGADEIFLGDQKIDPVWMDGLSVLLVANRSDVTLSESDLPDPDAPSEYFRAVLQSYRMAIPPPPSIGGEVDALYARAIAGFWSAAIARLELNDSVISNNLLGHLVGRAHGLINEKQVSMAAWKTDVNELDSLLEKLLTPNSDGIVIVESVKLWLESHSPLLCWIEDDEGESLLVGIANPSPEVHVLSFRWPNEKEASLTGEIAPETFQTFSVPRAAALIAEAVVIDESLSLALREHGLSSLLPPANLAAASQGRSAIEAQARAQPILLLEHGNNQVVIQVGSGRAAVRPPGLGFGTFLPAASLEEVRSGVLQSPPFEWSTSAGIRRRPFGWELLVECRCPAGSTPSKDEVIVVIGVESSHTISIRSDGNVESDDSGIRETLAVHRSKDRWRVRLPLANKWVTSSDGRAGRTEISIERIIEGTGSNAPAVFARRQFAGLAPLEIHQFAKGIPLDLSSWGLSSVTLTP
ncbi:MAG: hypothetical protein O3B75_03750 [Planctomycetota bacterium]|nr:hypothetical protein [Planctomycetota bacterium]